jgi:peptidoglycan/LPS O-acetylase OafA/YrhL
MNRSHDTSPTRTFPALDGYRAFAALAVLTTHVGFATGQTLSGPLGSLVHRLDFGVTLFFLLSGFLLYRPHVVAVMTASRAPRTVPYLWHRALRVLPAYWAAVVLALLLVRGNEGGALPVSVWLQQLLLLQTYQQDGLVPGLTQMWSLGAEVAFYLALPLLAAWLCARGHGDPLRVARRQLTLLGLVAMLSLGWNVWMRTTERLDVDLGGLWLPTFLDWFALGMALAVVHSLRATCPRTSWPRWLVTVDQAVTGSPWSCIAVGAGLFAIATTPVAGPLQLVIPAPSEAITKHVLYGATAFILLLPGVLGRPDRGPARWLSTAPLRWLGTVSYGIFLFHLIVLDLVLSQQERAYFTGGFLPVLVPTVVGSIVVAAVSWYGLERPLMRLRTWGPGKPREPNHEGSEASQHEALADLTVRP